MAPMKAQPCDTSLRTAPPSTGHSYAASLAIFSAIAFWPAVLFVLAFLFTPLAGLLLWNKEISGIGALTIGLAAVPIATHYFYLKYPQRFLQPLTLFLGMCLAITLVHGFFMIMIGGMSMASVEGVAIWEANQFVNQAYGVQRFIVPWALISHFAFSKVKFPALNCPLTDPEKKTALALLLKMLVVAYGIFGLSFLMKPEIASPLPKLPQPQIPFTHKSQVSTKSPFHALFDPSAAWSIVVKQVTFSNQNESPPWEKLPPLSSIPWKSEKIYARCKLILNPHRPYVLQAEFIDGAGKTVFDRTLRIIPKKDLWYAWFYHTIDHTENHPGNWIFRLSWKGHQIAEEKIKVQS